MWNAGKEVLVKFIRVLAVVLLGITALVILLAVVLPIAASLFLGFLMPGVGIDLPFSLDLSAKVWRIYSYPWFSLVFGLGLLVVFGWASRRLARGLRPNSFHEKAGMSQVCFSLSVALSVFSLLPVNSLHSSQAASVAILPSALLVERFSLGAWWAFPIQ